MNTVKCNKCGWYHFELPRETLEKGAKDFRDYFYTLDEYTRQKYYGKTHLTAEEHLASSMKCFNCGNTYKDFGPDDGNCPRGSTIQAIMARED